jgi:hypothetical protein
VGLCALQYFKFVVPAKNCTGQWEFGFLKAHKPQSATTTTWSGWSLRIDQPRRSILRGVDARGGQKGQAGWTGRRWCNKPGNVQLASAHHQRHKHPPTPSPAHPLISGMLQRGCRHTIFPTPPPGTRRSFPSPPPPKSAERIKRPAGCAPQASRLEAFLLLCWRPPASHAFSFCVGD